jgi:hypothetical protein
MTIVELLKTAQSDNKRLDVIIGDGIDPMKEIHDACKASYADVDHRNRNRIYELDSESWKKYEHVRHYTTNVRPSPSYDFVLHLARKGILRSIITTNYDTTLDSMFNIFKTDMPLPVNLNPILIHNEWSHFGYCSEIVSSTAIDFWKIHGSLSHVFCRGCSTLLKCPDFVIPFGSKSVTDRYNHPITHMYLPGKTSCCPIRLSPTEITGSTCGHYIHPNDWNIPNFRSILPFNKIIDKAMTQLRNDAFGIIFIGFKGNRNYEEINQVAEDLSGTGVHWIMYLSSSQQVSVESAPEHFHLRDIIINDGGIFEYSSTADIAGKLNEALRVSGLMSLTELIDYNNRFDDRYSSKEHWERILTI